MNQITVLSGPEWRRVWTDQQKGELVAAVSAPGANAAEIARPEDLRPQDFAEVQVQPEGPDDHRRVRTGDRTYSRRRLARASVGSAAVS